MVTFSFLSGSSDVEELDRPVPVSCSPGALTERLFCLQFSQAESPPGGTVGGGGGGHSSAAPLSAFYRLKKKKKKESALCMA